MRKAFFDLKLSQFSKYLNDIGILSGLDREQFQKQFYEISSDIYNSNDISTNDSTVNYIYFKEIISNTLVSYIQSLSEEKQKLMALNIFMKYNIREDIIKEKLLKIIRKKYLRIYFYKWRSGKEFITKDLKKAISPHIISNNSSYRNPIDQKYSFNLNENKENYLTNDNTIDTNNNFSKNNLKVNNSMANLNPQLLNISITPDIHTNNNYNNSNYYDNSLPDYIINNYTYDKSHQQIRLIELNNTYSTNYYRPNNYFNKNNHYTNNKVINNYNNKTYYNFKYQYPGRYTLNNSNSKNSNNLTTSKSSKANNKVKVNLEYLNNLSKSKTEHNLIPEKTSQYIKEQEEINNFCTFKPKINKSSSFSRYNNMSNKMSIERLYLDSKNRIARKELQTLKKTNLESKENTFQPKFISSSVKKIKKEFDQRLKDFENTKKNKIKKISHDLENEQREQCTFTPKINQSFNTKRNNNTINNSISKTSSQNQSMISKRKKIPAYKRLYNDNIDKKLRQEERLKQEVEKIKKNSSKISENNNNNYGKTKIEELYNDYKSKKNRLKLKKEQIEKEQGITFKPELISAKKYNNKINPNFYEREKEFLEKQQLNIETHKFLLENEQNKKKKIYSEEEKKEIYNNIVTRLYKDGVEKYIQKRSKGNNLEDNVYNINHNEIKDYFNKDKIFKNLSNNHKNDVNEYEFEPEPEEEIFSPNYEIIGLNENYDQMFQNKNYLDLSEEKNFNSNLIPMDLTKSELTN